MNKVKIETNKKVYSQITSFLDNLQKHDLLEVDDEIKSLHQNTGDSESEKSGSKKSESSQPKGL